jgi:hypothetical protein
MQKGGDATMRHLRTSEQESLEDALANMSITADELRLLNALARYGRRPSRKQLVQAISKAETATIMARRDLSKVWNGLERDFHEQA